MVTISIKAIYTVLGLTADGHEELLGLYMSETEGAHHWLSVLTDLHNRGIQDILIACVGGLKGFPEAIASIFPQTEVQLCVVHQIRNSLRYIASKDQKAFMADLMSQSFGPFLCHRVLVMFFNLVNAGSIGLIATPLIVSALL